MFCQKCGKENLDSAAFCNACGIPLNGTGKPSRKETTLSQVAQGGLVFGILGGILGVFGGLTGVVVGFIFFTVGGFVLCFIGASIYDLFRKQ